MIFTSFIFKGKLYVVTESGDLYRLDDLGFSTPAGWTWVFLGNVTLFRG